MGNLSFSFELAQQLYQSTERFPVDFDDAWLWLGYSRKDAAKRNFDKSGFIKGIDFEVHKPVELRPQGGFSNHEEIKLTCECFKQWGMMAGTEKGKEIRLHFLECERIAKAAMSQPPKSVAETIVMIGQQMVEQERRQAELEAKQNQLESRTEVVEEKVAALNGASNYSTIRGYCRVNRIRISEAAARQVGIIAGKICREKEYRIGNVPDERHGKVNSYPDDVIAEAISLIEKAS